MSNPDSIYTALSLQLYSSKTKSWKFIPDFDSGEYFGYSDRILHSASLNGRAHWVFQFATEDDTYITTFDYETELFGRIKAPSPPQIGCGYDTFRCLVTTFNDKFLCLGLYRKISVTISYLDIWVMQEYGDADSWTKEVTVGPIPNDLEVLDFSSKLKGLFLRHKLQSPTELYFWNCESPKTKGCYSMAKRRKVRGWVSPGLQVVEHVDVESLVSILE